jgi:hypothetical protein
MAGRNVDVIIVTLQSSAVFYPNVVSLTDRDRESVWIVSYDELALNHNMPK